MSEKSSRKRGFLSREDMRLWAHVTRSVRPMEGRIAFAVPVDPEPVPVVPTAAPARSAAPAPMAKGKPVPPPLQPLERRMRQKLARGRHDVDGVIDLHGMRQQEAHGALLGFIARAHREGRSLVLVITGKGAETEPMDRATRGVLRRMVPHWLGDPVVRRMVVGFEEAARGHGGAGALYVRIRKPGP